MRSRVVAIAICACLGAGSAWGRGGPPAPPRWLVIDGEIIPFHASVGGFREYLELIKTDNPALYAALVPDVIRLEKRKTIGDDLFTVGFGLFAAAIAIFVIIASRDCGFPSANDPNHAADTAAADACATRHLLISGVTLGLGGSIMIGTGIAQGALGPSRADLDELVNKHNRLNPQRMRIRIGYDPTRGLPVTGLAFSF